MKKEEKIGQRYDLIRACLSGGCPEMLPKIDEILHYISTGSGMEEMLPEVEKKEIRLSAVKRDITDLDKRLYESEAQLEALKQKKDAILAELRSIEREVRDQTWDMSQLLEKVDVASDKFGLSVKDIAKSIGDTNGKTYVELEGCIYRITAIYASGAKRIFEVDKRGYVLTDENKNGLVTAKDRNLSFSASITDLENSITKLRDTLIGDQWF